MFSIWWESLPSAMIHRLKNVCILKTAIFPSVISYFTVLPWALSGLILFSKFCIFKRDKHKYWFYVFAFTLPSTMQKSGMSHCWWISWYSYFSIIYLPLKKFTICTFLFLTYTPCNHIMWCSAQPKWTDWQLTWPIIRAGRSRYKRSGNFCGQL